MKSSRDKLVGFVAVGLGIVVVLIAAYASRRVILEVWHLSGLDSADKEERERAARALGEIGSARAIPLLAQASYESSEDAFEEASMMEKLFVDMSALSLVSPFEISVVGPIRRQRAFRINQGATLDSQFENLTKQVADRFRDNPYFESVERIALRTRKEAVVCLSEQLGSVNWHIRWQAVTLLGTLGRDAEDSVPDLKATLEDSNSFVRYAAAEALKSIGHDDER